MPKKAAEEWKSTGDGSVYRWADKEKTHAIVRGYTEVKTSLPVQDFISSLVAQAQTYLTNPVVEVETEYGQDYNRHYLALYGERPATEQELRRIVAAEDREEAGKKAREDREREEYERLQKKFGGK